MCHVLQPEGEIHRHCFVCKVSREQLNPTSYAMLGTSFYSEDHYNLLFRLDTEKNEWFLVDSSSA